MIEDTTILNYVATHFIVIFLILLCVVCTCMLIYGICTNFEISYPEEEIRRNIDFHSFLSNRSQKEFWEKELKKLQEKRGIYE